MKQIITIIGLLSISLTVFAQSSAPKNPTIRCFSNLRIETDPDDFGMNGKSISKEFNLVFENFDPHSAKMPNLEKSIELADDFILNISSRFTQQIGVENSDLSLVASISKKNNDKEVLAVATSHSKLANGDKQATAAFNLGVVNPAYWSQKKLKAGDLKYLDLQCFFSIEKSQFVNADFPK